jgi:hypothetical protein
MKGLAMFIKFISFINRYKFPLVYALCAPLFGLALVFTARTTPGFGQWYATSVFQIFPNILGRLFSLLPFSVFEVGLYALLIFIAVAALVILSDLLTDEGRKRLLIHIPKTLIVIACFSSTMFLILLLTCSINYNRDGIAEDMGIVVTSSTHQDLINLSSLLINDLAQISTHIQTSEDGTFYIDPKQVKIQSKLAMSSLGENYPSLAGYYPNPKPVMMSSWMSDVNLTGLFSPYTIEANFNQDVADYIIPYTICHELAHLRGYIKEDEAGFIAYVACASSNSIDLKYSGKLNALSYVLNALYRDSSEEEYLSILATVPPQALVDLVANQYYWQDHRSAVSEIATRTNDQYLKVNAQSDGVKSYGRMVDLLLAYHNVNALNV